MRKKMLLVLAVSLCTNSGGLAAWQADGSVPERTDDAFL